MKSPTSAKSNDSIELVIDELLAITQKRTVKVHVFASRKLMIETSTQLDKRSDGAIDGALAVGGFQHTSNNLQQRRFA